MKGGSVMNLMKAESPGPTVSKFVPRVRGTAKILYQIYLGMTLFYHCCPAAFRHEDI